MKDIKLSAVALIAIVVGGLSFYGGMMYQKSRPFSAGQGNFRPMMNRGVGSGNINGQPSKTMMRGGQFGGLLLGEIIAIDAGTMTIKTSDGGSMIIILNSETKYSRSAVANMNDMKLGDTVGVMGNKNSDGSATATMVQINPTFRNTPPSTPNP